MEAVAEDPGEQSEVVPDVAGDGEHGEAALVDPERDLERVRVEREGGAGSPRHLHPHRGAEPQPRRPAPRLHRPRPHTAPPPLPPDLALSWMRGEVSQGWVFQEQRGRESYVGICEPVMIFNGVLGSRI